MRKTLFIITVFNCILFSMNVVAQSLPQNKPRLLVLTDIGGDPDDVQSLRRLLVYSNKFRIEGLIASATLAKGDKTFQMREFHIYDAINDYALVRNNLLLHEKGFPTAGDLRKVVFSGQVNIGPDYLSLPPTSGSNHIIRAVDSSNEVLNIIIWGGSHDLSKALFDVKTTRTKREVKIFCSKIRIFSIGDQHNKLITKGSGAWIIENFPNLFYIQCGPLGRGMYQSDSVEKDKTILPIVEDGLVQLTSQKWVEENISCCGPLGKNYPSSVRHYPITPRNTKGVKEGDTPSWFYFLPNGLSDTGHPEWGSWGGRFILNKNKIYTDALDDHWSGDSGTNLRSEWTVARWREAYQNDFAARMSWCVLSYKDANHNPVAVIDGDSTQNILIRKVKPGKYVLLNGASSYDPDGGQLHYNWWIYKEVSLSNATIENNSNAIAKINISKSTPGSEIHIIMEITDDGNPKLYAYRRVILKIAP